MFVLTQNTYMAAKAGARTALTALSAVPNEFGANLASILDHSSKSVCWDGFVRDYPEAAALREFLDDAPCGSEKAS